MKPNLRSGPAFGLPAVIRFGGFLLFVSLLLVMLPFAAQAQTQPWMDKSLPPGQRASLLLAAMTLDEKITMVHGGGASSYVGHVPANTRLGIPELNLTDGPAGVGNGKTQVTAFPAPITVGASWDVNLLQSYGAAMGEEERDKGVNVHLAPMMNIVRVPQAGRNFEGYSEDPYLSSQAAYYEILGIQGTGIIATAKHYIDNDQEYQRDTISSDIDDRTQHEIYLPPFKASVQAGVGAVMCAYNKINNIYACENGPTQNGWLKNELGFQGWIMSDWGATHSTNASAIGGLDMEMPGGTFFGAPLKTSVQGGQVPQSRLDDMVKRILTSMFAAGLFDHPPVGNNNNNVQSAAHTQVARDGAAQGMVLLKNANSTLPLNTSTITSIAVIGSVASSNPIVTGGGSAGVNVPYVVTPLQGITNRAGAGITIRYAQGDSNGTAVAAQYLKTPGGAQGLQGQYYTNTTLSGSPALTRTDATVDFNWNGASPGTGIAGTNWSARWTGTLTPPTTGTYALILSSDDGSRMYVNGALTINNWGDHADQSVSAVMALTGGQVYNIEIQYYQGGGGSDVHFRWVMPSDTAISAAVTAASQSSVAVVVVGVNSSEGSDRNSLSLPGSQDMLISNVAQANPKTIVVVYSPAQVLMPWSSQASAILMGWIPGQEVGNALASVLFGDVNPSGKLPITIAQNVGDYPANTAQQYPGVNGHVTYSEGLRVGYRHFDIQSITPLFAFGHGLSYTTFGYANLSVTPTTSPTGNVTVAVDVSNTGTRAGAEVAQVYLGFPAAAGEPPKQLKAFQKVMLQPGQTQRLTFTLTPEAFSYWNAGSWTVALGAYQVMVGSSSRDIRLTGSFQVQSGPTATPTNTSVGPTNTPTNTPIPITNTPTNTPTGGCGATNVAQGKPATASSVTGGNTAVMAVDGNAGTRWESAQGVDPQWIYVDLGSTQSICRVRLNWETAYGKSYQIQTSNDASAWTTIFSTTTGDGGIDDLMGLSGSGRYVRMNGTVRATQWGYSLWEYEIYTGSGGPTPTVTPTPTSTPTNTSVGPTNTPTLTGTPVPSTNLALNKPVTCSSAENAGTACANAVDGNTGTRWSSAFSDPQWIRVDLGATMSLSRVVLRWEAAYGKSYQIQTSTDGTNWTTIFSTTTGDGGVDDLTGLAGSGRYVRMNGTVRATQYGYSLWEFEVY